MILKDNFDDKKLTNGSMNILVGCNNTKVHTVV